MNYITTNRKLLKPVLIGGVLVIGYVNAAKLLGVTTGSISQAVKNGSKCRGFEVKAAPGAWMDI